MGQHALLIEQFDGLVLDLDGTVYVGSEPIAYAVESLNTCESIYGAKVCYATNNASRTPEEVAQVLRGFGLSVEVNDVVTSAQVASAMLAQQLASGSAVLVVGGPAIGEALSAAGLVAVWSSADDPVAVIQGFHPDIGWRDLAHGSVAVHRGLPWVATNRDLTVPTPLGIAPGNGTLVNAIVSATGRQPVVAGKPQPAIMLLAAEHRGVSSPLAIGDRLDTDMKAARAAGIPSLMVLTGVSGARDVCAAPADQRPDFFGYDLRALLQPAQAAQVDGRNVSCAGWTVAVEGNGVRVTGTGGRLISGVLALATAAWLSLDMNARVDEPAVVALAGVIEKLKKQN